MLVVLFLVCFSEIELFVFSKKKCFLTDFFAVFVFGSIGLYLCFVGFLEAQKILQLCFLLVVVFLFCFTLIKIFVFPVFQFFFDSYFHLADHLETCNGVVA